MSLPCPPSVSSGRSGNPSHPEGIQENPPGAGEKTGVRLKLRKIPSRNRPRSQAEPLQRGKGLPAHLTATKPLHNTSAQGLYSSLYREPGGEVEAPGCGSWEPEDIFLQLYPAWIARSSSRLPSTGIACRGRLEESGPNKCVVSS